MGGLQSIVVVAGYRQATVLTHEGESKVPVRVATRLALYVPLGDDPPA